MDAPNAIGVLQMFPMGGNWLSSSGVDTVSTLTRGGGKIDDCSTSSAVPMTGSDALVMTASSSSGIMVGKAAAAADAGAAAAPPLSLGRM